MAKALRYPARPRSITTSARERLLASATKLFCRHGINSVGVDAIVEGAGTAKASLYNIFGSKDALACEVLNHEGLRWRNWIFKGIDSCDGDPAAKLLHIFDLLHVWFGHREYFGCPFINTVAQHDKCDNKMREIALKHKKIVLDRIRQLVFAAGMHHPEETAHELGIIIDGAIVAALITQDSKVAQVAKNIAKVLIEARTTHCEADNLQSA
jgi:AcrR family transcriptional regulator